MRCRPRRAAAHAARALRAARRPATRGAASAQRSRQHLRVVELGLGAHEVREGGSRRRGGCAAATPGQDSARKRALSRGTCCSVALTGERSLQLALVHLRAPPDLEALRFAIKLLLGPLTAHGHEITPFE